MLHQFFDRGTVFFDRGGALFVDRGGALFFDRDQKKSLLFFFIAIKKIRDQKVFDRGASG